MKKFLLPCLLINASLLGSAQGQLPKHSLRLAASYTLIGVTFGQHTTVAGYGLIYVRHLANDRLAFETSLIYAAHHLPTTSSVQEAHLRRATADLSLLYNVLKSSRHKIRFGVGPSLWYRHEAVSLATDTPIPPAATSVELSSTDVYRDGWKAGLNMVSEYDYFLSPRFTLGGRVSVSYMGATTVPTLGLTTGSNF